MNSDFLILGLIRIISIIPLLLMFLSVSKTYFNRLHQINGLRKVRLTLVAMFLALLIDNVIFAYTNIVSSLTASNYSINTTLAILDKFLLALSYFLMYFLFKHASKKD